jgi:hypothetical protein
MIPYCLGRDRKNGLSAPFSSYQALNVDEESDFKNLLTEIGRELGVLVQVPETCPSVPQRISDRCAFPRMEQTTQATQKKRTPTR